MNHLGYADILETRAAPFGNTSAALARYGADLLGRAIGHEIAAETPAAWLGAARFDGHGVYGQLIAQCIDGATRRVMAHMAVRDILGA